MQLDLNEKADPDVGDLLPETAGNFIDLVRFTNSAMRSSSDCVNINCIFNTTMLVQGLFSFLFFFF